MSEAGYGSAERMLNETVVQCADADIMFRIHYWGMKWRHYDNPVHRHSFYEVCYALGGEGEYEDEGKTYVLHGGSQFVSVPGHWHQIRSKGGLQLFYVAFEPAGEQLQGNALNRYETALHSVGNPVIEDHENVSALLWRTLYRQAESGGFEYERMASVAGFLLRSFQDVFAPQTVETPREFGTSRSSSQLVELAKRFVRDNLSRTLKLEDVASYLHVSDRHLSRMFRKHGGETFGECVTRERLQLAESMLKTTVFTIKQIAEDTGFQSVHYFTRVFRGQFGMPPAQYREQCMKREQQRPR